jgi:mannose-6-phosphate isomerase-like protein (cupin superfamily)
MESSKEGRELGSSWSLVQTSRSQTVNGFRRFAVHPRLVEKPWGYEIIYAVTPHYCGKLLLVRAGEELSLQYHCRKDETLYLTEGLAEVAIGELGEASVTEVLRPGSAVHVPPGTVHRLHALQDSVFLEVSTPELDDVVRLEDRYGRSQNGG